MALHTFICIQKFFVILLSTKRPTKINQVLIWIRNKNRNKEKLTSKSIAARKYNIATLMVKFLRFQFILFTVSEGRKLWRTFKTKRKKFKFQLLKFTLQTLLLLKYKQYTKYCENNYPISKNVNYLSLVLVGCFNYNEHSWRTRRQSTFIVRNETWNVDARKQTIRAERKKLT